MERRSFIKRTRTKRLYQQLNYRIQFIGIKIEISKEKDTRTRRNKSQEDKGKLSLNIIELVIFKLIAGIRKQTRRTFIIKEITSNQTYRI